jgi:hypothetical protein
MSMGGLSSTTIDGQPVKYGDLCSVEIHEGDKSRFVLADFVEMSDAGDAWFRCRYATDRVGGDRYFSDYQVSVGCITVIGDETPDMFCGESI